MERPQSRHERRRIMDAVTYLKTYEKMRDAEGMLPFEHLFDVDSTPEERVAIVEEWGKENNKKKIEDVVEEISRIVDKHRTTITELYMEILQLHLRIDDVEEDIQDLIAEVRDDEL